MTICCLVKCLVGLQELAGKLADGVPRAEVSTLFVDKAEGTLGRYAVEFYQLREYGVMRGGVRTLKNQILIPVSANSVTHTPPPAWAKAAP